MLLDGQEVLLGERLRGRHERALVAVLDRAQQRVEGNDRLPGADVPLEQPLHRSLGCEIAVDLGDRLLLLGVSVERERRAVAGQRAPRCSQRHAEARSRSAAVRASASRRTSSSSNASRSRPISASASARPWTEASASARPGRRSFEQRRGRHGSPRVPMSSSAWARKLAESLRRDVLARRIDGGEVGGLRLPVEVVGGHGEAVPVRAAAQAHGASWNELLLEPGLAEPRRLDLAGVVGTRAVRILSRPRLRWMPSGRRPDDCLLSPKRSQIRLVGTGGS